MRHGDSDGRKAGDRPPPGLHVEQDLAFQRREWAVQRVGWAAAVAVLAAAVSGLLGNGPLSHAEASGAGDALRVSYERIARSGAPTTFRIDADAAGAETTLWISHTLAGRIRIESVAPEPVRWWSTPARTGMVFATPAGAAPGDRMEVVIRAKPEAIGRLRGEVGIDGRDPPARVSVLALP